MKPIHGKGKIVTIDSGFCITVGIIAMHKHGVFGQAPIKKHRQYWRCHVPGNEIDNYFAEKELSSTMIYWQEITDIDFLIHCTRDENYITKMMSLHGILDKIQDHSTGHWVSRVWKLFKYSKLISCHNQAKHLVDNQNSCQHAPIGIDQTWHTKWRPTKQFTFLIGITKVNAMNLQKWACK